MTGFRVGIALLLLPLALPLALPAAEALGDADAWRVWAEFDRLTSLLGGTVSLLAAVVILTLPPGCLLAFLLYRSDLPGRRLARFLLILCLFLPLPVLATAWQAVFGAGGWLPAGWWGEAGLAVWTPWGQGLAAAVWIHTLAALPWVVLLAGLGFRTVERELEEDARTLGPWFWVFWRVTLPRAGPALSAALLWIVVQTAGEITVTDLFQVRTFAEEVYTQMVAPEIAAGDAVRRATLLCLPILFLLTAAVGLVARSILGRMPSRERQLREPLVVSLGRWRRPAAGLVVLVLVLLIGLPLASLLWMAGTPQGGEWDPGYLLSRLRLLWREEFRLLALCLVTAAITGLLASLLALAASFAVRGTTWGTACLLLLAGVAWTLPGPLVGEGYRLLVDRVLTVTGEPAWLRRLLHDGPSIFPLIAVGLLRFFPCALAVIGPAVHAIPQSVLELARLDGLSPVAVLREVILPLTRGAVLTAGLLVALLSLGELAAGKRVSTPNVPSYAESLFTQMHYGVDADLALRCLLLLAVVVPGAVVFAASNRGRA